MSNSTQPKKIEIPKTRESTPAVFSVFQDSLENYFKEIRKNTSAYLQTASDLQEQIVESRKKNADNVLSIQKMTYEKLGGTDKLPDAVLDLAKMYAGQATQTVNLQNKMIITSLETLAKNIEAFNKNSTSFEEINKKLIEYWASIIKQEIKTS